MIDSSKNGNKKVCKIIKGIIIILLSILAAHSIFSYVFFFVVPSCLDVDKTKYAGEGYIYPLSVVEPNDSSEYLVIFEKDCQPLEFYAIEDSEFIKKYKNSFVVYKTKWCFKLQDHRDFVVIKDGKRVSFSNLGNFPTALCYDDFFMLKCKKITSLSEYCKENNIEYY